MLEKISRYLLGYMTVEIRGNDKSRFINHAVKSRVNFWDYKGSPDKEEYFVKTNLFRRGKLEEIARRTGSEIKFHDIKGLPTKLVYIKHRPGFILGLIISIFIITALSDNIWVLRAKGSQVYSEEEVLAAAEKLGVSFGADYDDFDPVNAGRLMMLQLPEIAWVSINNDGVLTEINIKDRDAPPVMEEEHKGIYNVVAGKTGFLRAIEAYEGLPVAKTDHVIKAGELCITGIWQNKYGYTFTSSAYGKVMAEVQQNFYVNMPRKKTIFTEISKVRKRELDIFSLRIPLSVSSADFKLCSKEYKECQLELLGMKLPLVYRETEYTELCENIRIMGRDEWEAAALAKLREDQEKYMENGAELLKEKNVVSFKGDNCIIKSECIFIEDIAIRQEVLTDKSILDD